MQIVRDTALAGVNLNDYIPHTWVIDDIVVNKDLSTSIGFDVETLPFFTLSAKSQEDIYNHFCGWLNSLPPTVNVQFVWGVSHSVQDVDAKLDDSLNNVLNAARESYDKHVADVLANWDKENARRAALGLPNLPKPDISPFKPSDSALLAERYINEVKERWAQFSKSKCLRRYKLRVILTLAPILDKQARIKRAIADAKAESAEEKNYPKQGIKAFFADLFTAFTTPPPATYYNPSEWEEIKSTWAPIADSLAVTLTACGFQTSRMKEQEIVNLLYSMWNPKSSLTTTAPDVESLPMEMLPEMYLSDSVSLDKHNGAFYTDSCVHKILSLETPASSLFVNMFSAILDEQYIPNLHVVLNIQPYDRAKRVAELQKELPLLSGRVAKDPKLHVAIDQIHSEVYSLQSSQEGCWRAAMYFHIWGDDSAEVDGYATELKRLGRVCGNTTIVSESIAAWRYWIAMQPFWGRDTDMYRHFHVSTSQIGCLLPLSGHVERLANNEPVSMLLETANASIFNYNPMDNLRLNNYNTLISGGSGTGKSFLAGSILLNMILKQARIICIDIGASYKSLCEAFNGEYITMDANSQNQTINPLARPKGGNSASARFNAIRWLEVALLEKGRTMEKDVQSDLDNAISQLYSKFDNAGDNVEPTLSDLRLLLQNFSSPKMQDLAKRLEMYCQGGQHGALFDGQTKINLDNPFLVFDLTLIKDHPDLGPLTLMSVMSNVERMASNYPKQPKVLLLDEAWALLNTESGAKFVVEAFRTYRKLNVAILGISQEVADWTGGHLKGVVSNVSSYFVLTQANSGTLETAAQIVGFTEEEVAIAGSLRKEKGKYSQALFIQRGQSGRFSTIVVNRTTPLQYALMTTDGSDKAEIQRIIESEHCSNLEARIIFSKRHPFGV